jgi:ABC-2 type transport system ATP-binding protein
VTKDARVRLEGVTKRFRDVLALRDISVSFPRGTVGLLGPNGAGKSTLLRVLLGQVVPDTGRAWIVGCEPRSRSGRFEARRRVGYMPESDCLLAGASAVELVIALGRVSGLTRSDAIMRTHEALDYVGLDESRYRPMDGYSTGMKQRVKLAQALVHDPPVLLLDEPTNGLDPAGRRHMLTLVRDLGTTQGKDVILCSHLLRDVEATCDHVVVLKEGSLRTSGSIAELTAAQDLWIQVRVEGDSLNFGRVLAAEGIEHEVIGAGRFRLRAPAREGDRLLGLAHGAGVVVSTLAPERSTLEDVFVGALSGDVDGEPGGDLAGELPGKLSGRGSK